METKEQKVQRGIESKLIPNPFSLSGYKFTHWTTIPDGSGESYSDESSITCNNDIDLYAQWEALHYNISRTLEFVQTLSISVGGNGGSNNIYLGWYDDHRPGSCYGWGGSSSSITGIFDGTQKTITAEAGTGGFSYYWGWSSFGSSNGSNGSVNWDNLSPKGDESVTSDAPYVKIEKL